MSWVNIRKSNSGTVCIDPVYSNVFESWCEDLYFEDPEELYEYAPNVGDWEIDKSNKLLDYISTLNEDDQNNICEKCIYMAMWCIAEYEERNGLD